MTFEERELPVTRGFLIDTIDDLARMINAGFETTATKTELNERMDAVEQRLDGMDSRINGMDDKFDAIFAELRHIREDMESMDSRIDVVDLQIRVSALEEKAGIRKKPNIIR